MVGARDPLWTSLGYFSLYRVVLAGVFLVSSLVYGDSLGLGSFDIDLFRHWAIGYLVAAVLLYAVLWRLRRFFDWQLGAQVGTDIVALTLLMFASGGIRSGLGVMLLVSLAAAALVARRRLTYLFAALAAIAVLIEQAVWVLLHDQPTTNFLQPGLLATGFFATAGVTAELAQRVVSNERLARERGRELETQMRVNRLVLEDMPDGVLVLSAGGSVTQHNPQAVRLLGVEPLAGRQIETLLPELAPPWQVWRAAPGRPPEVTHDVSARGRYLRARLFDAGIEETLTVVFLEDMTRSREQAEQLKLAALGRLTANIAHEIRNPLTAISHAAELLSEGGDASARERLTRIIHDNTRRLERLVSDVLQLSRRDRRAPERLALGAWLEPFLDEFARNEAIERDRIALECPRAVAVSFDREHLRQVMWNLLRNAVRHAPAGTARIRVVVVAFGRQVELNVFDDGPGVAAEHRGKLFEPFFTTESKGTGLGLYLARELCAANLAFLEYVADSPGAHFRILVREA